MTKNITSLKSAKGSLTWINIISARKAEIEYLRRKYKFSELDLRDSFASQYAQRPKFYQRNGYLFLILQFPFYNPKTRKIEPEELDFFISKGQIITVHKNNLPPLVELFNLCASDSFYRDQYLSDNNAAFLYEILIRLQEYCYPLLDHISIDIKNIESNIFAGRERRMVAEIMLVKSNILNTRRIMEAHKNAIQKLIQEKAPYFPAEKLKIFYNDLLEHTKNIWDIMQSQKELIETLENTNSTLVSFKINDIMRTLTVFSVIVFPLTLFAAIFGMNTVNGMPFMDDPYGFWAIIGIMLTVTLIMFVFFKKKKWL
jgi:magnesium transporter